MARTPSNMVPLGTQAPDFTLPDTVSGKTLSFEEVTGEKATLIMFICNHCPFVMHIHDGLVGLIRDYQDKGVSFVAISSNDVENYPDDSPEKMKQLFATLGLTSPYLYDETQDVAKAYDAACTPDFYLYDAELKLVYRGQLDDSRPENGKPVTGKDLRQAIDCTLQGEPAPEPQVPSVGCNIKWKNS